MRKNEYNSLQEFIEEYDGKEYKDHQSFMGIEFTYHSIYYRMCAEPLYFGDGHGHMLPVDFPTLPDGRKGRYDVVIVHWKGKWVGECDYELVGWYADLDDVLKNCKIEGRPFAEVIMDDETEIIGKD